MSKRPGGAGDKRRWLWVGSGLLGLGAAVIAGRKLTGGGPGDAAGTVRERWLGPQVSDEQWAADREYVQAGLRQVWADGPVTQVFDQGVGEPIICIPIVAHVEVIYARQLREFSRDHRVLTYRRPEGTDHPIEIADRAEEVRQLLDRLGIERAHIIARSEGAISAAEFAYRYPERCLSLVLITMGMRARIPPVAVNNIRNWLMANLPIAEKFVSDAGVRHQVVTYLSGPEQRLTYEQLMEVYEHIPDFRKMYKYSAVPLLRHHDMRGKAQRLNVPTLLLGSEEDPRASRADLEELAAALPDCRGVHMLERGGHFANYIAGDEMNRLIRAFYGQLAADKARKQVETSSGR